jgi:diacylglycerol kinase family enzyme
MVAEVGGQLPSGRAPVQEGLHCVRIPGSPERSEATLPSTLAGMRSLVLVANPVASAFTAGLYRDVLRLLTGPYDVTARWPNNSSEARRAAADAAAAGCDVVVAMGGDGVAHQVAGGLAGSATSLGIVPAGTTNVLSRNLGIPARPRAAAEAIAAGAIRRVPFARLTLEGPQEPVEDIVLFAAGIGFDAAVVERAERDPLRKIHSGAVHYARSAMAVAFGPYRHRLPHLRVEAHGRRFDATSAIVQLHETWTFFGPLPLGLAPRPALPGMTVLATGRASPLRTVMLTARAMAGRDPGRSPDTEVWQGVERLHVAADPPAWLQADGELLGRAARVEIERSAGRLRVIGAPER